MRVFLSEVVGTGILVFIGLMGGFNAKFLNITDPLPSIIAACMGVWMGMTVSMSNSAAHLNPSVTLGLAANGKLSWKKVPLYIISQFIGAFAACIACYYNYKEGLDHFDGGIRSFDGSPTATGGVWATIPSADVGLITCAVDTFLGSLMLLLMISAVCDPTNCEVPKYLYPSYVAFGVMGIIYAFGYNCGVAINPARDIIPRIFTLIVGYGTDGFKALNGLYWLIPVFISPIGGIAGVTLYNFTICKFKEKPEHLRSEAVPLRSVNDKA